MKNVSWRLYHLIIVSNLVSNTLTLKLKTQQPVKHTYPEHFGNLTLINVSSNNKNVDIFLPLDWFEFLIPLKLLQWQYFTIIVGNHSQNSVKNRDWNWSLKIWDKIFVVMKEHYEADIEMAEMFKLFPSVKTSKSNSTILMNSHDDDEPYSSNHQQLQLQFVCFVEPPEFLLLISKIPRFILQSWLFLTKSSDENKILKSWENVFGQFDFNLDVDIFIGIFNESLLTYNVYELYRRSSSASIQILFYCTVKSNNEFQGEFCKADKYQRRQNLQGMFIKAVAVSVNPFDVNVNKSTNNPQNWTINGGLYAEIFSIIANEINIRYKVIILDGYRFGKFNSVNKSWDGMLGMVSRNEVDISMNPLSMAADRINFVDFSFAIQSVGVRIYIRRTVENQSINWKFYSNPFSPFLHLAILICYIGLLVVMRIILTVGRVKDDELTVTQSSWIILSALCQKGSHMIPSRTSGKLVWFIAYFSFFIIYCGYSATLTSQLSVPPPLKIPFENLLGLTHAGHGWTGGPIKGDFTYIFMQKTCPEILAKSTNNSRSQQCELLTRAWTRVVSPIDSSLPKNFLEGLRKVLTGKFAFITTMTGARYAIDTQMTNKEGCNIHEMQDEPLSSHLAFAFKKHLPFKKLFNSKLIRLYQSGTLNRLRSKWLPKLKKCIKNTEVVSEKDATLYDVASAPILFFMGLCLSGLILTIEYFLTSQTLSSHENKFPFPFQHQVKIKDDGNMVKTTDSYIYNSTSTLQPNYEYYWKRYLS